MIRWLSLMPREHRASPESSVIPASVHVTDSTPGAECTSGFCIACLLSFFSFKFSPGSRFLNLNNWVRETGLQLSEQIPGRDVVTRTVVEPLLLELQLSLHTILTTLPWGLFLSPEKSQPSSVTGKGVWSLHGPVSTELSLQLQNYCDTPT